MLPLVYDALRNLATAQLAHERADHSLNATALVHEVYLRFVDRETQQSFKSRAYFFSAAAEAMRRILIEHARKQQTQKRGGDLRRVDLAEIHIAEPLRSSDLIDLDDALRRFEQHDEQAAQLVKLRYFAGLSNERAAQCMGISPRNLATVYRALEQPAKAIALLEEATEAPHALQTRLPRFLLDLYADTKQASQAASLAEIMSAEIRLVQPEASVALAERLERLAIPLIEAGAIEQALKWLEECHDIRVKQQPDAWQTFRAKSQLASVLLLQQSYDQAEPLLLAGYAGMKQRQATIPANSRRHLHQALERLTLYEETNNQDESSKWQNEREELNRLKPDQ